VGSFLEDISMRYTAFGLGIATGVLELAGAIIGLGVAGVGFTSNGGGLLPATLGVGMVIPLAVATIFCAVAIMFVRDSRPLGLIIAAAALGAVVAGGPFALIGGGVGLLVARLTFRIDRAAALT
jgi:hypothetical protein